MSNPVQSEDFGTLAQLVEQRTFNPFVVGSTPARPTKKFENLDCDKHSRFFFDPFTRKPPVACRIGGGGL